MNSCKQRCLAYLKRHSGEWIPKGRICDLARAHGGYTGDQTGRRLRELAADHYIKVKEVDGHAHYKYDGDDERKRLASLEWFDSLPDAPQAPTTRVYA